MLQSTDHQKVQFFKARGIFRKKAVLHTAPTDLLSQTWLESSSICPLGPILVSPGEIIIFLMKFILLEVLYQARKYNLKNSYMYLKMAKGLRYKSNFCPIIEKQQNDKPIK